MVTDHNLRPVDIAQTHTLHTLSPDTAPVQMPPPVTLTHHMHTLLEASQGACVNACVLVRVCVSLHFPDALVPPWLLQTVLCARGPISHV